MLGSAIPVLAFFALLGWAAAKSGGNPGGFGVNSELNDVRVSQKPASGFSLELLNGGNLALSDLRGQVVMVDFWSSWCPPCRLEAPVLEEVYQEYGGLPLEFVGIDVWDRLADAEEFVSRYGVTYPNGVDRRGAIAIDYGVRGIPEKFFIGPDGVLMKKFVGPMDRDTLRRILNDLLAPKESNSVHNPR